MRTTALSSTPDAGGRVWPACAALLFAAGLAAGWDSLGYPWNGDDLHLIRAYTATELLGTLTGPWDPDGIETTGLRPLTTLFNDARAVAFGEAVALHRVFLVALFAALLTVLGASAVRLGESPWWVALAGVVALAAKNSSYHFLWLTDGVHLLQGLFFACGLYSLLRYVEQGARHQYAWAIALAALALLTREDSLVMLPILLVCGAYLASVTGRARARLGLVAAGLGGVALVLLAWRAAVIPGGVDAAGYITGLRGMAAMAYWTVCLSGARAPSRWLFLAVGALAVAAAATLDGRDRRRAGMWLLATLLAASPGYVMAKADLLVFSIPLYALFLASVAGALVRRRPSWRTPLVLLALVLIAISARASRQDQLAMHPLSASQIVRDWDVLYGSYRTATIPEGRREALRLKLEGLGVADAGIDIDAWAEALDRRNPGSNRGGVFVPERPFLAP